MTNTTFETAIPLAIDTSIANTFSETDGYVHYFTASLDPTKSYTVYTESNLDLYATVYDSNRNVIKEDDDSGNDYNPSITIENTSEIFIKIGGYSGSQVSGNYNLHLAEVKPIAVTGVKFLEKTLYYLNEGQNYALSCAIEPIDAFNKDIILSSSDSNVVSITPYDTITIVSAGTAIITVTTVDGSFTDTCVIEVIDKPAFSGGIGTADNPYLISTAKELNDLRYMSYETFKQVANIDLSGYSNWNPISHFGGSYDGGNFSISNLTINRSNEDSVGLFRSCSSIRNVNMVNCNVLGNINVGILVGYINSNSRINFCTVSGNVEGRDCVGGLVGRMWSWSTIDNSGADVVVTGSGSSAGGLVGYHGENAVVKNCFSLGEVVGKEDVGGLIGTLYRGRLEHSYSKSKIIGANFVGGVVGNIVSGESSYCFGLNPSINLTPESTSTRVGTACGNGGAVRVHFFKFLSTMNYPQNALIHGESISLEESKKSTTYAKSNWDFYGVWEMDSNDLPKLAPVDKVKGLGTEYEPYEVRNVEELRAVERSLYSYYIQTSNIDLSSYPNWEPLGNDYEADTFGIYYNGNNFEIQNLTCISNNDNVGLFGLTDYSEFKNMKLTNVKIDCQLSSNVGAIIGLDKNSTIYNCQVEGIIKANSEVGGIIGSGHLTSNCSFIGEINGNNFVGGIGGSLDSSLYNETLNSIIIGKNNVGGISGKGSASRCKFNGTITGESVVGGIVGEGDVDGSYSSGSISGVDKVGGIVGISQFIENSYSACSIIGDSNVGGIVGEIIDSEEINLKNAINLNNSIHGTTNVGTIYGNSTIDVSSFILTCLSLDSTSSNNISINIQGMLIDDLQSKQKSTYTNLLDFKDIWSIKEGQSYPIRIEEYPNSKGSGTELDPYLIETVIDLYNIKHSPKSHYKQIANIDLSSWGNWVPIGDGTMDIRFHEFRHFGGSYDGNSYIIKNLQIIDQDGMHDSKITGLFGEIKGTKEKRSKIKNIKIDDFKVYLNDRYECGGLAGIIIYTDIDNCSINGTIEFEDSDKIGGLIGQASYSTIKNSNSNCVLNHKNVFCSHIGGLLSAGTEVIIDNCNVISNSISGDWSVGGIASDLRSSSISNCSVNANIFSNNSGTGGITGSIDNSEVIKCSFTGNIEGEDSVGGISGIADSTNFSQCISEASIKGSYNVGGLIGEVLIYDTTKTIDNCSYKGSVNGGNNTGGLIGYCDEYHVINCYSEGNVNNISGYVGGLFGSVNKSIVEDCYSKSNVTGFNYNVGGFSGDGWWNQLKNCYSTGKVIMLTEEDVISSNLGGFLGLSEEDNIIDCYSEGEVIGGYYNIGGFIGELLDTTITNSYSKGNVTSESETQDTLDDSNSIGGFIGASTGGKLSKCSSTNVISGDGHCTGGLVGYCSDSEISDSFHIGNVKGKTNVGGMIGLADKLLLSNSYVTGKIEGEAVVGGIAGEVTDSKINSTFVLDGEISSTDTNHCGTIYGKDVSLNVDLNRCYYISSIIAPSNILIQGVSMIPEESKKKSIYETTGWKFNDVWAIDENTSFPYFYVVKEVVPVVKPEWTKPWVNPSTGDGIIDQYTYRNIYTRVEVDKRISESIEIKELKDQLQELKAYVDDILQNRNK